MKSNKFEVVLLNDDGTESGTRLFKSYKEITETLNIDYHLVRDINRICDGKLNKKFYHNQLNVLLKKIKIKTILQKVNIDFLNK